MMNKTSKKKRTHPQRRAEPQADTPALWITDMLRGAALTLGFGAVLLLILSLAAYFTPDPNRWIAPCGLGAAALTALIGGIISVRIHGQGALVSGLSNAAICSALILLLSLFFTPYASGYSPMISCLVHAGFFVCSVAGAYLGVSRPQKKKRR